MEAWTCPDVPSGKEIRADALGCPGGQVDQCPDQDDVVDLHIDGQDTNSPH